MKPKPKIYITHPDPSIEEIAKWVGVSKRRMKELQILVAEWIEADRRAHPSKSSATNSARQHPKRVVSR
jgi:hypothetical protein